MLPSSHIVSNYCESTFDLDITFIPESFDWDNHQLINDEEQPEVFNLEIN